MISVTNRANWEAHFDGETLYDCGLNVYDEYDNFLFGKENIESVTILSNNNYICSSIPRDDCTIKILNWSALSQTTRNYLSTIDNIIHIRFVVNGEETVGSKEFLISQVKIDRQSRNATIQSNNFLTKLNQKQGISNYNILFPNDIIDRCLPAGAKALPLGVTVAQAYQQYAIYLMKGLKLKRGSNPYNLTPVPDYVDYSITPSVRFNIKNIKDDYDYDYQDKRANLQVFGIEAGTEALISQSSITVSPTGNYFYYDKPYCITKATIGGGTSSVYRFSSGVNVYRNTTGTKTLMVYGYEAIKTSIPDETTEYFSAYTVETGSTKAGEIQAFMRSYYANNKIVSFDCRIDPTIEPLDVIETDFDEGTMRYVAEEVSIAFNGGFSGSIKGRIVQEITSLTAPSVVFNINQANFNAGQNDSYSFAVTNSNAIAVDVIFSDGSDTIVKTIPANTTSTFYQTTDLNNTYDVAVKYREDNITCQFKRGVLESSSVVALAEVTTVADPVISIDYQNNDFYFTNNNPMAVELVCWWSDYDYAFRTEIKGGQTLILSPDENSQFYNSDFARSIEVAYEDFMQGNLQDDYQCCLEGQLGDSNNVIVLNATPLAPQISNATNGYVTIQNPNPYSVTAYIVGSQIYGDITVGGNQSVTYGYDIDLNTDWTDWKNNNLQYDVYCYFESSSHTSDNTIIYEENYQ